MSDTSPAPSAPAAPAMPPAPVGLREPAHRVSPRAVPYWRITNTLVAVVILAIAVPLYVFLSDQQWWATALLALIVIWSIVEIVIAPPVRYRIHRWEVDDVAVHTLEGFIDRDSRIAPVNRIQTIDSSQGPIMRRFGLMSITVTTASSAGSIDINCIEEGEARELIARLTAITAAVEGDAT